LNQPEEIFFESKGKKVANFDISKQRPKTKMTDPTQPEAKFFDPIPSLVLAEKSF